MQQRAASEREHLQHRASEWLAGWRRHLDYFQTFRQSEQQQQQQQQTVHNALIPNP